MKFTFQSGDIRMKAIITFVGLLEKFTFQSGDIRIPFNLSILL